MLNLCTTHLEGQVLVIGDGQGRAPHRTRLGIRRHAVRGQPRRQRLGQYMRGHRQYMGGAAAVHEGPEHEEPCRVCRGGQHSGRQYHGSSNSSRMTSSGHASINTTTLSSCSQPAAGAQPAPVPSPAAAATAPAWFPPAACSGRRSWTPGSSPHTRGDHGRRMTSQQLPPGSGPPRQQSGAAPVCVRHGGSEGPTVGIRSDRGAEGGGRLDARHAGCARCMRQGDQTRMTLSPSDPT